MNGWNERANEIFADAIGISNSQSRRKFLESACDSDELRKSVESLLVDHDRAANFLESPAIEMEPSSKLPPLAAIGSVIGSYKLLEVIGEGGFGVVYMAEQKKPIRRKVALKVIKPGMDTREVIARFEAERQALAMMDHANIAKVIDAGTTETGRPYFVMELVKGVPITQFCDENRLSNRQRLSLFTDICRAVQHAHQKGVIHRDLKPSNVMATIHNGEPFIKIIDFGVAKAINQELTEKTLFTSYGQLVGTPQYMSPEQAQISSVDVDTRSDVYSLGVLLFELLTGSTPLCPKRLRESGYDEMRRIIREEDSPKPSEHLRVGEHELTDIAEHRSSNPAGMKRFLVGDIDWIVMQSLDKDRDRRYSTAENFADDIQRFLDGEPIEARPPSRIYRISKFVAKNRGTVVASSIVAAALIVGLVATSWALVRVKQEVAHTENAKSQLEQANSQLAIKNKRLRDKFLHDAISYAMSPNRELTMRSLSVAQEAGVSESNCEMVRGILARSEGQLDLAADLLNRAVDLDPSNLAAKCELFGVSWDKGELKEFGRLGSAISDMDPVTAEDFVFKGKAYLIMWNHAEALELIEQGQKMHPSPLFNVIHADALGDAGFEAKNLDMIKSAYDELVYAQSHLRPDHAGVRATMLFVVCQYVAVAKLENQKYEQLIKIGDECADVLANSKDPTKQVARAFYFDDVKEDLDDAKDAWISVVNNSSGDLWRSLYAAFLLRSDGIEEALKQFQTLEERSDVSLAWESVLLALDSDERRAKAAAIWERANKTALVEKFALINTLVLLGHEEGLQTVSRTWTKPAWLLPNIDFATGRISERVLCEKSDSEGASDLAHHLIALKSLRDGNREKAMRHLRIVADKWPFSKDYWARGILREMERRPNWPPPFK